MGLLSASVDLLHGQFLPISPGNIPAAFTHIHLGRLYQFSLKKISVK